MMSGKVVTSKLSDILVYSQVKLPCDNRGYKPQLLKCGL